MKKQLNRTSWLISLLISMIFCITFIAVGSNDRKKNVKNNLESYLYIASGFYDGSNIDEVALEMSTADSNLRISIIDFDGNILFELNPYHEFTNQLVRDEVKDRGTVFERDGEFSTIYYIANTDSGHYIILSIPSPSIGDIIFNYIVLSIFIFLIMAFISYFAIEVLNSKVFYPINLELKNIASISKDNTHYVDNDINSIANKLKIIQYSINEMINSIVYEKDKLEFVVDSMNQGFFVLDDEGQIALINSYALNIFNKSRNKKDINFVGKHYLYLIRNVHLQNYIESTINQGTTSIVDIVIDNKIYLVNIYPSKETWTNNNNTRNGAAILILDVTERRNLEHTKRDFFANASHELKSPLTTIIGYQQLLNEKIVTDPEEVDDAIKRTMKEAKRMDKILGEMLDLSRIESKVDVVIEDLNLKSIIEELVESYQIEMNNKNLTVKLDLEDCIVRINQSHCIQLLKNLIENAVKYNNDGGKIEIKLKDNNFKIKDTGIGIAKSDQTRIFERFYRVDKGRSKEMGGTGLGLAIVKHLCSVYSISINVKSELNIGTEFILGFPQL